METNQTIETTENQKLEPVARFAELQALVAGMAADFEKFYRGNNKAAGTRVRNSMQDLKNLAQAIRVEVQGIKNGKPGATGEGDTEATETDTDVQ